MSLFTDIGRKLLDGFRKKTMEGIDYETYTIEQMHEEHQEYFGEIFYDGWDEKENLKYLADQDVAGYEKHYSDDCVDNYKRIRLAMKLFRISESWKPFLDYVMPTEEKQMDYFIHNNPPIQLMMMSLNNKALVKWEANLDNIKSILFDIQKDDAEKFIASMKKLQESKEEVDEGDSKFNDLLKQVEKQIKPIIIRNPKVVTPHTEAKEKENQKKKEKMRKLYFKYREKGYDEKSSLNLIQTKHYPNHSTGTISSYIKK